MIKGEDKTLPFQEKKIQTNLSDLIKKKQNMNKIQTESEFSQKVLQTTANCLLLTLNSIN